MKKYTELIFNHNRLKKYRSKPLHLLCFALALFVSTAIMAQTVTTDNLDYTVGQTAYAFGSGWPAGTQITLNVHEEPMQHPDVVSYTTTDSEGNFNNIAVYTFELHDLGATYTLTVTDNFGTSVEAIFTDAPPAANLDQVRNGSAASPVDPGNWVIGNLGPTQSHYAEGMSVAYRAVMTDMPPATAVTLILEYDVKHSSRHALDYLTNYERIEPHNLAFGHIAENIDPTIGVAGEAEPPEHIFPIPAPPSIEQSSGRAAYSQF